MTRGTRRTLTRAARTAPSCVVTAAVLAVSVLGACTSQPADPQTPVPASATAGSQAPAAVQPDPGMTPIEAARCTTTRSLSGKGRVPLTAVFPGAETKAFSEPREVVPGPDAADPATCPGELPSRPQCDGLVPWTGLLPAEFVPASRVSRLVQGYLLTMPKQAGNQAPPESSAGTKVVTYSLVDLVPGDPARLVDYLDAGFEACAKATPSTIGGAAALVGTVRSEYGAGTAEAVLLRRGTHLVWATLDGAGWKQGEQQRAVATLVTRLL